MPSLCYEDNGLINTQSDISDKFYTSVNDGGIARCVPPEQCNSSISGKCCLFNNSKDNSALYNSSFSINSGVGDREKVLFIGFEESWERDLWSAWLIQVNIYLYIKHTHSNISVAICAFII